MAWQVEHSRDVEPEPGTDRDYAREYELRHEDGGKAKTTVEFAAPSNGSANVAMRALRPWLANDDVPPRRLLVGPDGEARAPEAATS